MLCRIAEAIREETARILWAERLVCELGKEVPPDVDRIKRIRRTIGGMKEQVMRLENKRLELQKPRGGKRSRSSVMEEVE